MSPWDALLWALALVAWLGVALQLLCWLTGLVVLSGLLAVLLAVVLRRDPPCSLDVVEEVEEVEDVDEVEEPAPFTVVLDSLFLQRCLEMLGQGRDEELVLVTGVCLSDCAIPMHVVPMDYDYQGIAGARASSFSGRDRLSALTRSGHRLIGLFHSHPGDGPDAVSPSGTDRSTQARLEKLGHRVISGIFSRDGYVRVFTCDLAFEVSVHGNGVTEVEDGLFQIEQDINQGLVQNACRA